MIPIYTVEEARQSILRRDSALEPDVPAAVRDSLRRIFGADITPAAAVAQILADVRARGDDALLEWTRRIDGVALPGVVVDPDVYKRQEDHLRQAKERPRAKNG